MFIFEGWNRDGFWLTAPFETTTLVDVIGWYLRTGFGGRMFWFALVLAVLPLNNGVLVFDWEV